MTLIFEYFLIKNYQSTNEVMSFTTSIFLSCDEYKLKYNTRYKIHIMQPDTIVYFIKLC